MIPICRVWDIKNEKMIYLSEFERWGIIDHTKDSTQIATGPNCIFVSDNPECFVWMQFLGTQDANGNDIFELDILKDEWHDNNYAIPSIEEGQINFNLGIFECGVSQANDSIKLGNKFENKDIFERVAEFL
ncbi:MAG: YopX family protein [Leptospira sp.]|nr:YopX family protein [Leptospira sp.]